MAEFTEFTELDSGAHGPGVYEEGVYEPMPVFVSQKVKFFVDRDNLIDSADLSANVSSQLPLARLQHPSKRKFWRGGGTNPTITIDCGTEKPVDSMLLVGENFAEGTTIEWRYSNDAFVTEDEQAGILSVISKPGYDLVYPILLTEPIAGRDWRLIINNPGSPDGTTTVGRPFLGLRQEFGINIVWPWRFGVEDLSRTEYSGVGEPLRVLRAKRRVITAQLWKITDEETAHIDLVDFLYDVGLSQDLFLSISSDAQPAIAWRHTIYGHFTQLGEMVEESARIWQPGQMVFRES